MPALLAPLLAFAAAAAPVFDAPQVELLPLGEVLGSGLAPHRVSFLALGPDGAPLTGLEGKVTATAGEVGALTAAGPGLYTAEWTPPRTDLGEDVELRLKGKLPDKQKVDRTWAIPVTAPLGQRVRLAATPAAPVLGQDAQVKLQVTLTGGATASLDGADLLLLSSVGAVGAVQALGGGGYEATLTLPADGPPHTALVTVADRREPGRTYGHIALPLAKTMTVPVKAPKGCKVLVDVGGTTYGPVEVDKKGVAAVALTLPPGGAEGARQRVVDCPQAADGPLVLPPAPARRVQLMPLHAGLPADPGVQVPVRAVAVRPDGQPDGDANLQFTATLGSFGPARHEGNGVWLSTYTPPPSPMAATATVAAVVQRPDGTADRAEQPLQLVPLRPAALKVQSTPAALGPDDVALELQLRVEGPGGEGLPGRQIGLTLAGAKLAAPVTDHGDGSYTAKLSRSGKGPVEVVATARSPASGNPVRDIVMLPTRTRLPPDGLSSSALVLLTLDEFGYPVANAPIGLRLVRGDGQLPAKATADANGVAQVAYTAGRKAGLVHIEVSAGGHSRAIGLLQLPPEAAAGFDLRPTELPPTEAQRAAAAGWAPIVTTLTVPRG